MNRLSRPRLAVTIGDPASIGPEIVLKSLQDSSLSEISITVIGSKDILQETYEQLQEICPLASLESLSILDIPVQEKIIVSQGNSISGKASFLYLESAIKRTLAGEFDGVVTAPISKTLWHEAGYIYPGQTEVLAKYCNVSKYGMLLVARSPHTGFTLRTLLATTHIALSQVSSQLNAELMAVKLDLLVESLKKDFGISNPKIVIAGLNPHSGENGQLGSEEKDWLIPWLETERRLRSEIELIGPVPPDTMWVKPGQAWYKSEVANAADGYIALYHDQGLIPVKLMAFDQAINTTIGLPFIRTSPDHGTAFDIAGKGIANPSSMLEAIKLAAELSVCR